MDGYLKRGQVFELKDGMCVSVPILSNIEESYVSLFDIPAPKICVIIGKINAYDFFLSSKDVLIEEICEKVVNENFDKQKIRNFINTIVDYSNVGGYIENLAGNYLVIDTVESEGHNYVKAKKLKCGLYDPYGTVINFYQGECDKECIIHSNEIEEVRDFWETIK